MNKTRIAWAGFWLNVEKTPTCWLWKAGCFSNGYGQFRFAGKKLKAHRSSWEPIKLQGLEPPVIIIDDPILEHLETFEEGLKKLDKRKRRGMRRKYSRFIKLLTGESCGKKSSIRK